MALVLEPIFGGRKRRVIQTTRTVRAGGSAARFQTVRKRRVLFAGGRGTLHCSTTLHLREEYDC
jgi:hypothetical protein